MAEKPSAEHPRIPESVSLPCMNKVDQQDSENSETDTFVEQLDENANLLSMSSANEDELCATLHSSEITAIAKTFIAMAEELNKPERQMSPETSLGRLQRYLGVSASALNEALTFLESPSNERFSKLLISREGVLRGVKHLEDLGTAMLSICLIYIATNVLELGENSYKSEREYITKCLKDVESKQDRIGKLVDDAANILKDIVHNPFSRNSTLKAFRFDNIVREARLEIDSCEKSLVGAEDAIQMLVFKVQGRRVFLVTARYTGLAAVLYGLYKSYHKGSMSLVASLGCACGCVGVTALLGSRYAAQIYNELVSMQYQHKYAKERLRDLDKRLLDHWQHLRNLRKRKSIKTQTSVDGDPDRCISLPF